MRLLLTVLCFVGLFSSSCKKSAPGPQTCEFPSGLTAESIVLEVATALNCHLTPGERLRPGETIVESMNVIAEGDDQFRCRTYPYGEATDASFLVTAEGLRELRFYWHGLNDNRSTELFETVLGDLTGEYGDPRDTQERDVGDAVSVYHRFGDRNSPVNISLIHLSSTVSLSYRLADFGEDESEESPQRREFESSDERGLEVMHSVPRLPFTPADRVELCGRPGRSSESNVSLVTAGSYVTIRGWSEEQVSVLPAEVPRTGECIRSNVNSSVPDVTIATEEGEVRVTIPYGPGETYMVFAGEKPPHLCNTLDDDLCQGVVVYASENATSFSVTEAYYSHLVFGVEVAEFNRRSVPRVRFTVENTGSRSIDRLRVRIVFLDESGNPIGDEVVTAVSVGLSGAGLYNIRDEPLEPNFAVRSPTSRSSYHYANDMVADRWDEGSVRFEVTELSFSGPSTP